MGTICLGEEPGEVMGYGVAGDLAFRLRGRKLGSHIVLEHQNNLFVNAPFVAYDVADERGEAELRLYQDARIVIDRFMSNSPGLYKLQDITRRARESPLVQIPAKEQ